MYNILSGMRILELYAFIAAPLAGLTLSQLGAAEVIRVDPAGGGMDYIRWRHCQRKLGLAISAA